MEREAVEREPLERAAVERDVPDERDAPVEREAPDERDPDAREPEEEERDAVERLVVREPLRAVPEFDRELRVEREAEEAFDCVSAWRSLSKSLSACLFVRAALRRSAASAVVTSL